MAYSTEAQLRFNCRKLTATNFDTTQVALGIAEADKTVKTDLANIVDFTNVPANSTGTGFPDFLNLLSQYKTAEKCLVSAYGAAREAEQVSDIQHWQKEYDDLLADVKAGKVTLALTTGTSISKGTVTYTNACKRNVAPRLGDGEFGDFQDEDDQADERPLN